MKHLGPESLLIVVDDFVEAFFADDLAEAGGRRKLDVAAFFMLNVVLIRAHLVD